MTDSLAARLADVRDRVARAATRAGRDPSSVRLIAVSKTFPSDAVRSAAALGQRDFGENKVQEALTKMDQTTDLSVRWHLIGHLQSNKAKKAAARFDVIHSVDRVALVRALDEAARVAERRIQLLVQVDLAGETTKHGALPDVVGTVLNASRDCEWARIVGLMLLPPAEDDCERARPYFSQLRALRDGFIGDGVPAAMLAELSMGMSHDFEVAIEEGATMVRVGSAIFGARL